MNEFFKGKSVLVTGACGTVGNELVQQLLEMPELGQLTGIDNNESELFFLEQRFQHKSNAKFFLADVRDHEKLYRIFRDIDIVFHAAAFKHVILCERSPFEAVQTNILGVQNVISAALENRVKRIIFTSSDKAVNPTNVMGTSKLMGERLITAANSRLHEDGSVFASTRFGNVLGSRGSVIPIFCEQIKKGGPVTVTDEEMSRFIMSIKEAASLVIDSVGLAKGGEVFVTKMPVIRIVDLAKIMIQDLAPVYGHRPENIQITIIGTKPGEKMYEELMNGEEVRRSIELKRYFVIKPAFMGFYRSTSYDYPGVVSNDVINPYNSANEKPLSKAGFLDFLRNNELLGEVQEEMWKPAERFWPNG
jgi:FlaA1/EpsC-like NDP-sugar epimerase